MMLWLPVIILAYFFFSLTYIGDKLVLGGPPKAKLYTFFSGLLGVLAVLLIPFIDFSFPTHTAWIWIVLEALTYIAGLYTMFLALEKFEVSRVMTVIGAIQPLMIFAFTWLFWQGQVISGAHLLAFALLFLGSIVISFQKNLHFNKGYFLLILFSALMFSLDYVFSKMVFLHQPFLQGIIWMRLVGFALVLFLLFDKKLRIQIFSKQEGFDKKTGIIFFGTQLMGGIAGVLQSFAVSLAPVVYLAVINSLRGVQYVFLFGITLFLSSFFPTIIKEDISKKVVIQKTVAILFIVAGLALLVIY